MNPIYKGFALPLEYYINKRGVSESTFVTELAAAYGGDVKQWALWVNNLLNGQMMPYQGMKHTPLAEKLAILMGYRSTAELYPLEFRGEPGKYMLRWNVAIKAKALKAEAPSKTAAAAPPPSAPDNAASPATPVAVVIPDNIPEAQRKNYAVLATRHGARRPAMLEILSRYESFRKAAEAVLAAMPEQPTLLGGGKAKTMKVPGGITAVEGGIALLLRATKGDPVYGTQVATLEAKPPAYLVKFAEMHGKTVQQLLACTAS
jgi:hypothetical protein